MSQLPPEPGQGDGNMPPNDATPDIGRDAATNPDRDAATNPGRDAATNPGRDAGSEADHAAEHVAAPDASLGEAVSDPASDSASDHGRDPFGDLFDDDRKAAGGPASRRAAREFRERSSSRSNKRRRRPAYQIHTRKSRKGLVGGLVAIAFFVALVVVAGFIFMDPIKAVMAGGSPAAADYPGPGTGEVTFTIHSGDIGDDIATNLQSAGVIGSSKIFYKLLVGQITEPVFMPGSYKLAEKMSAQGALNALENPANLIASSFVIPEGTALKDALPLIADGTQIPLSELQAAAKDYKSFGIPEEAPSLEGFLFPATYSLDPGLSAHDVLQKLVDRMFEALDSAGVAPKDRFRVVTLASVIQRESGPVEGDAAKVSRVFLNRLAEGWDLQSDATVAYGSGNTHRVETTEAERDDASNPYNTYAHAGLPVGPISNPGDVAIDAAIHPATGSWMFFVTWNLETGATVFSTTLAQHDAAVAKWQEWMRDHPGYG